jgi:acyl carrier protein
MTENTTIEQLTELFRELFDDNAIQLRPDTTADDIEGWDSFTHLNMIIAVEAHFGIKIHPKEVESLTNVGDLVKLIEMRQGKAG